MTSQRDDAPFKSGFVALVGRPNVGKSTLLNRLVGHKVAIISPKPQTTRRRILGVMGGPNYQVVLVDTPGFYPPAHRLGEKMLKSAQQEAREADLVLFLLDAQKPDTDADYRAARFLENMSREKAIPVLMVVNKIDLVRPEKRAALLRRVRGTPPDENAEQSAMPFPILVRAVSAHTGEGLEELVAAILERLAEGAAFFPPDQVTDQSLKLQIEELVREKVLEATRQEVPHSIHVEIEDLEERREGEMLYLRGFIYVEKDSQKGIVVGKGGERLKWIGTGARGEIELLVGKQVFLDLRVKVKEEWRRRDDLLRAWGYE